MSGRIIPSAKASQVLKIAAKKGIATCRQCGYPFGPRDELVSRLAFKHHYYYHKECAERLNII